MARILVVQHSGVGGPGRLGVTLRDHGFRLDIRRPDLPAEKGGTGLPSSLAGYGGLVVLGGPQNVDQPHAWMAGEMELIRAAHRAELPVVGICLGAQLIGEALGGKVGRMEGGPEVGFGPVKLTVPAQTHTMMSGVPWTAPMFHSHSYEVQQMPSGAVLLASSDRCKVQAFAVGMRTFGFQFHLEVDQPMINALLKLDHDQLAHAGLTQEQVAQQADAQYARFATIADRLCVNLVSYAFPFNRLLSA